MAFAHVQASSRVSGSAASGDITLSSTTQDNLVVVHVMTDSGTATVTSITDDQGNTYVVGTKQNGVGDDHSGTQGYGVQVTGGVTLVTVNFSASVAFNIGADEYSGGADNNAQVFDESLGAFDTGTALSVTTLTPSQSGNLVVATRVTEATKTYTAGTDYTLSLSGTTGRVSSQYRLSAVA